MADTEGHSDHGCTHYERGCKKLCRTCDKFYDCRLCHDEEVAEHQYDRFATDTVKCNACETVQPFGLRCINPECERVFGIYICFHCKLIDGKRDHTQLFHCDKCKICRVGTQDTFTHCDICNMCISSGPHQCRPDALKASCPVCREYMFDSRRPVALLRCGHPIHDECLALLMNHDFRCPLCLKSIGGMDLINASIDSHLQAWERTSHPLDASTLAHHVNTISLISCNECQRRSEVPFHYVYHKCAHCQGYNTSVLSTRKRTGDEKREPPPSANL